MPSLRMKAKSSSGFPRETNGLHICQNSCKISKKSSDVIASQHETEHVTCILNKQDDSLLYKLNNHEIRGSDDADSHELLGEEKLHFQKQLLPSTDFDSAEAACTSNVETFYSSILESIDNHNGRHAIDGGSSKEADILSINDENRQSRHTCEYHISNASDFDISDMIASVLPMDQNTSYDEIIDTTPFLSYRCDEPGIFLDDEYVALPCLEDNMETSRYCSDPVLQFDESSFNMAIHQLRSCNQESDINAYQDWGQSDCFDPHMFIRCLPDLSEVATTFQPLCLPDETHVKRSVTLVLDLDETLIHSSMEHCDNADFTFQVCVDLKELTVYVKQRPHLRTFLERVSEMFQVMVFTASQGIYAKPLLDIIDPDGKFISRRAYRESCVLSDGNYIKDLTVLGLDLAKVVIIDNSPKVFQLQVNNGIPIESWFDDPTDSALLSLLPFLETLVDAEDVRPIIAKRFGNKH